MVKLVCLMKQMDLFFGDNGLCCKVHSDKLKLKVTGIPPETNVYARLRSTSFKSNVSPWTDQVVAKTLASTDGSSSGGSGTDNSTPEFRY